MNNPLVQPDPGLYIWTIVTFLVLVALLAKFAWGPLLQALEHPGPRPAVLLIDEVDRADEEFEAFLFEMLAESAVTVPELGTLRAAVPPVVILTSNRTRDLHDALKRRCLYH